ncbi:MAG: YicC family protein [Ruminococcus sp.]|nr:YicC family protein [Ruminococcus sp.]
MIRSMTGYGRAQKILNGRDILVEIRSVNHRYYEYSSRIPRSYNYIDEKLKAMLKSGISRGKVEVNVTINNIEGRDTVVALNKGLAEEYIKVLKEFGEEINEKYVDYDEIDDYIDDDLTLSKLIKIPDVFTIQKAPDDEEQVWNDVSQVASEALAKFVEMRGVEGEKLRNDVLDKAEGILKMVSKVEEQSPKTVENYRSKLYQKLTEILESKDIDQQRILTEAAIFAEKVAVDEETVRLRSHISQLKDMLGTEDAVGRKLDFIVQEMNREVNTIGSKAQDLNITKVVVDMKAEIEKIREQIQNIE